MTWDISVATGKLAWYTIHISVGAAFYELSNSSLAKEIVTYLYILHIVIPLSFTLNGAHKQK